jgi:hypothetical protein
MGAHRSKSDVRAASSWKYRCLFLLLACLACSAKAYGNASLLIEEPYGFFGSINPTGHAAIYLNRVCAETPTQLRRCQPGEAGVVISRYSRIRKLDWVAIPLLPYLYAVEQLEDVPQWADKATVEKMREQYAEAHLESIVSMTKGYDTKRVWPMLLGVAYIRKIYSFEITTTDEQDDRLIDEYNGTANETHFNLFTNNCADFSRELLNSYYPSAVRRSYTADVAITTPKQIAKSLSNYARKHDSLELTEIIIPQVPGTIPRSHTNRGVIESLVKTKKYALVIGAFNPYLLAGMAIDYLKNGRFRLENNAPVIPVADQQQALSGSKPTSEEQALTGHEPDTTSKGFLAVGQSP